jgi:Ca2+-binding RTX toxin-like protein
MAIIRGTSGDDQLNGTTGGDDFLLWQGGNDTVNGGGGNDNFWMGGALNAGDKLNGGAGRDHIFLNGDYSAGLVLNADTITNIEVMSLVGGHSYNLTMNDGNVAAGRSFLVKAESLGAANSLTFDGSAETDGHLYVVGGKGNDTIIGGQQADRIHLEEGGTDTAQGGGGNDVFYLGSNLTASDQIDGGTGSDTVVATGFGGSNSITFTSTTISGVEDLVLGSASNLSITTNDGTVAAGATMTFDASRVNGFSFDGSAETDGRLNIIGGTGNDNLTGGANADTFHLEQGGADSALGGGGNDTFYLGSAFTAQDTIGGGAGTDTVILAGTGTPSVTFSSTTMTGVEKLVLGSGHSYTLTTDDATVGAGQALTVDGSHLLAANALVFNGSAETDGSFVILGGRGNDVLTGGANIDTFHLENGGADTVQGGGGNDRIFMGASLTAADQIDGGAGTDMVVLNGATAVTFNATTITNVEQISLVAGHSYSLTTNDATVAAGHLLTVNGSTLGATDTLTFDGSAESDGTFAITDGAGNDVLTGGAQADTFTVTGGGNDTVHGGGGNDTINVGTAFTAADAIDGGAGTDLVKVAGGGTFVFGASTITNVEQLELDSGSYNLTTVDANVAAGATLTVNAAGVGAGNTLTFDGSAETDGSFAIIGGPGDNILTGGALSDTFDLSAGGTDTVHGGGGNDTITMAATLTAADTIDGGAGTDTLSLNGDYSAALVFGATTMTNVETLSLATGHSYNLVLNDGNVAAGATLTVDGSALAGSDSLIVDGSAETDGSFNFIAGAGAVNHLKGGGGADTFNLTGVNSLADTQALGNGGNDTFAFAGNFNSSSQVIDGGAGTNTLSLNGTYSSVSLSGNIDNIQTVSFAGGHSYTGVTVSGDVAGGGTLTLDATALQSGDAFGLDASASSDPIVLNAGDGTYTVTGTGQADQFNMGAHFGAADSINGGAGNDTLSLNGDYSAGLTFGAATMTNVESIVLTAGHSYNLTTNDATVAALATLTVDASGLSATDSLTFDGSAETDGSFAITGGAGNEVLTGGANADTFHLESGGVDTVHGGGGADHIFLGAALTASDQIDGGAGTDTLILNGGATVTFNATTVTNVEQLNLLAGHSYSLTTNNATVAAGQTLTVDASALGAGNGLAFDGSAETDGSFAITGGAGNDVLTGGALADTFDISNGGVDTVHGGAGNDTFTLGAAFTAADTIDGGAGSDTLVLNGDYSAGVTMNATTMTNVETIQLTAGQSYKLTTVDANVAAGATLLVNSTNVGNSLIFDGSAETDGKFVIFGTAGDDVITGGAGNDNITVRLGGTDTVHAGAGDDTISLAASFKAADVIDGGTGSDTISLNGDYSAGVTMNATTMTNVETILLAAGNSYKLTTVDANVAAGATLTVNASNVGNKLIFDGSAETDGKFVIFGTAGDDVISGGAGNDNITVRLGGTDTVHAGGGDDTISLAASFKAADVIDGGTGNDTISLNGDYSAGLTLNATTMTNIETMLLAAAHSYKLTTVDANVAAGATLTVNASSVGVGNSVTFDGSAETDGAFHFIGGAGSDTLTGGAKDDTFDLSANDGTITDTATGGTGNDSFTLSGAGTVHDQIAGGAGSDTIILAGALASATLNAARVSSIETININNTANLSVVGDIAGGGQTLHIDATGSSGAVQTDLSQATSALYSYVGSGSQDDTVIFGGNFNVNDTINGGGAPNGDTLVLNGDYSGGNALVFNDTTIANIDTVTFDDGFSYNLTLTDANISNASSMALDASQLTAGHTLTVDDTAESTGSLVFTGGAGDDVVHAGSGADTLTGGGGNDILDAGVGQSQINGGAGQDTITVDAATDFQFFSYGAVTDSTGPTYDIVQGMNFDSASFSIGSFDPTLVTGIDANVTTGALDTGVNFNSELAAAIGAGQLAANHALLFTPNSSSSGLAGHTFLVVDVNGTAGYQAGQDLVMDVTGFTGTLVAGDFVT